MSRRRTFYVVEEGRVILVRGWQAGDLLREGGWRPIYHGSARAFAVEKRHAADVITYLEYRGFVVDADVQASTVRPAAAPLVAEVPELALFGEEGL